MKRAGLISFIAAFVVLAVACTAVRTFPYGARPGETVALAVGSPDNLTVDNIDNVQFVSDAAPGSPVDITANVRSVFRLYADKTSPVYMDSIGTGTGQIVRTSAHEPWISFLVIDMPEELSPGTPLPAGPGRIAITTTNAVTYPTISSHINDKTIAIEILPETSSGDGTAATLDYEFGTCCSLPGNLSLLEPAPRVLVRSDITDATGITGGYGAIELKVDFSGTTSIPVDQSNIRVIAEDMTLFTNSNRNVITGVKDEVLSVIMLSTSEQLKPYEMRFEAVLTSDNRFTGTPPTVSNVTFYDINGATVTDTTNYNVELR
jgi:hypothetical protein